MAVNSEIVEVRRNNIVAGVAIPVDIKTFNASDIKVNYGPSRVTPIEAIAGVDFTATVDPNDDFTVSVVPTAALVTKVLAVGPNTIYIRRELNYLSDFTENDSFIRRRIAQEFDRTVMRFQQLASGVQRAADGDDELAALIVSEATTRGNADTALGSAISSEATTRGNADTALGALITNLTNALNAEISTRDQRDLPAGGAIGQVLAKTGAGDYAVAWTAAGAGDMIRANNGSDFLDPALAFNTLFGPPTNVGNVDLNTLKTPGRYLVGATSPNLPGNLSGIVTVARAAVGSSVVRQTFEPSMSVVAADTTSVSVPRMLFRYVTIADSTASAWKASNDLTGQIGIELGAALTGDRSIVIDLHASGTPNTLDFSARMLRDPGVNGNYNFFQTGTGDINFEGGGTLKRNGDKVVTAINGVLNNPAPTQINQSAGALVHRLDRVYVGKFVSADGNLYTGTQVGPFPDDPLGNTHATQFASWSALGHSAVMGLSRGKENPVPGSMGIIGIQGRVYNDHPTLLTQSAYGAYFDAVREAGHGFTTALEVDIVNKGTTVTLSPVQNLPAGMTPAIWVAGGAELAVNAATCAIAIINNAAQFDKGIIFRTDALVNKTIGSTANLREAITLGRRVALAFYNDTDSVIGKIFSESPNPSADAVFADGGFELRTQGGVQLFRVAVDGAISFPAAALATTAGASYGKWWTISTADGLKKVQLFNV